MESYEPEKSTELKKLISDSDTEAPQVVEIDSNYWNSQRLSSYLAGIDSAVDESNFERALTLCYTCLLDFVNNLLRIYSDIDYISTEIDATYYY